MASNHVGFLFVSSKPPVRFVSEEESFKEINRVVTMMFDMVVDNHQNIYVYDVCLSKPIKLVGRISITFNETILIQTLNAEFTELASKLCNTFEALNARYIAI